MNDDDKFKLPNRDIYVPKTISIEPLIQRMYECAEMIHDNPRWRKIIEDRAKLNNIVEDYKKQVEEEL